MAQCWRCASAAGRQSLGSGSQQHSKPPKAKRRVTWCMGWTRISAPRVSVRSKDRSRYAGDEGIARNLVEGSERVASNLLAVSTSCASRWRASRRCLSRSAAVCDRSGTQHVCACKYKLVKRMQFCPDPYTLISAEETELWHVYKNPYLPTSFNPDSTGRFAAQGATPPRAMLYAGDTSDCVLCFGKQCCEISCPRRPST